MGVGVTCPTCRSNFAFICRKCKSVETEIYESFELVNYFQTRSLYYLKCRMCQTEFDYALCPECQTKVIPEKPFVTGDKGHGPVKRCFIATACLDGNSRALNQLYVFRDEILVKNKTGRQFIRYYYALGPGLAAAIQRSNLLKLLVKYVLVYPAYYTSLAAMKIVSLLNKKGQP